MSDEKEDERRKSTGLELRDYVAFVIASMQTTLLPIVILIVVMILLLLFLRP
jgi:hypothetical protein